MYQIITLLSFLLFTQPAIAQDVSSISVNTQGEVELPADIIQFNINLNARADSPQKAYELHKKREDVLVDLLKKYQIKEDDIRFQPVSIHKNYQNNYQQDEKTEVSYQTNQRVNLKLTDFEVYEKTQVTLIENDFDSFSGHFMSTAQEKGKDDALRKAIREARRKAGIIAEEAGVKLGPVRKINYGDFQVFMPYQREAAALKMAGQANLMEFEQTVVVRANITMEFYIKE